MRSLTRITMAVLLFLLTTAAAALASGPVQLLTVQEAALPDSRVYGMAERLPSDGPEIWVSDLEVPAAAPTFPLVVRFAEKGDVPVDAATVRLECLKSNPIDLTPRIRPYAGKQGISLQSVSLPPGLYRFRVAVGDVKGRFSEKEFTVKVSVIF
ncbi:hypothetical protein L4X63_18130 [Geomonas sp. Red32]|uniref:hypothetical protein n=1 Tax=Geomonas sp. Red32 TaxID=2912856 RepID=UPI00202CDC3D|nr:hypothetical protein [Geomonas sp. Red32]MCM0083508.1 hypothetical protein [Geomonas sp. Red32]